MWPMNSFDLALHALIDIAVWGSRMVETLSDKSNTRGELPQVRGDP